MKNIFFATLSIFFAFSAFSFIQMEEPISQQQVNFSNVQSEAKSLASSQTLFNLTPEETKLLWLAKLEKVKQDPNINATQLGLVSNLITQLESMPKNVYKMNSTIQDLGISLAGQFSEADFNGAFTSLEPYSLSGVNTPICQICINRLQARITYNPTPTGGIPDCNCSWTCGDPISSYSCTLRESPNCCIMTMTGCGFLFLNHCDGLDRL